MGTPDLINVVGEQGRGRPAPTEEYLSIAELTKRIPYAAQTIRNLMGRGEFRRDIHYLKPRGRIISGGARSRCGSRGSGPKRIARTPGISYVELQ